MSEEGLLRGYFSNDNVKDSICSGSGAREPRGGLKMGRRNHCG
jgi:hypothetical protein